MSARRSPLGIPAPLLVVTDRHGHPRPLAETVTACLAGGARWVWFRDRDLPPGERRAMAARLAALVRGTGGVLTVGADPELAAAVGAGVHLPGGATPAMIAAARRTVGASRLVGVSAHTAREVEAARDSGADYVTLSPVFATASKPGYGPALGLDGIAAAAGSAFPVIGLGGIEAANVGACRLAGSAGVAVMGGAMRASDPSEAVRALLGAWAAGAAPPSPLPARGEKPSDASPCLQEAQAEPERR